MTGSPAVLLPGDGLVVALLPVGDLSVLVLLAAFAVWGAWRGTLRQIGALALLWVAFPLATRYGPRLEGSVVKAVSATGSDLRAIAWLVVFTGTLVAGGALLALLQPVLGRVRPGGRTAAALLGLVHGAVVLTVLGYAVLLGADGASPHVRRFERGPAVQAMQVVASGIRRAVRLPPWLEKRLDAVDRRVDGPPSPAVRTPTEVVRQARGARDGRRRPRHTGPASKVSEEVEMRACRPFALALLVACCPPLPAAGAEPSPEEGRFAGRAREVDLRPEIERRGIPYRGQGRRPTCSIHAVTFLLEFACSGLLGPEFADLSDDYLNHAANLAVGKTDDGDFFHAATQGHAVYGIVREAEMPGRRRYHFEDVSFPEDLIAKGRATRDRAGLLAHWIRPLDGGKGLSDRQLDLVLDALERGVPIATGRSHSQVLVGYTLSDEHDGGGEFLLRDSGGRGPYVREDFARLKRSVNDVLLFDHAPRPDLAEGWWFLRCREGGRYLDFDSNSLQRDGGRVQVWGPSGWDNQKFGFDPVGGDAYVLRSKRDPTRVLDRSGHDVRIRGFAGTPAQRFRIVPAGSGFYEIRPDASEDVPLRLEFAEHAVRKNGGLVRLAAAQGTPNQSFCLERTE